MKYEEVEGDLITLAKEGKFDVIAHGCNCFCTMGAGLAPQMAKAFGCDYFPLEQRTTVNDNGKTIETGNYGDINKLGQIDYIVKGIKNGKVYSGWSVPSEGMQELAVVNCYSQYGFGKNHAEGSVAPLDYEALRLCLRKINHIFKGKHIGLPKIGCHLAGGKWDAGDLTPQEKEDFWKYDQQDEYQFVKEIVQRELVDMDITVIVYKPNK